MPCGPPLKASGKPRLADIWTPGRHNGTTSTQHFESLTTAAQGVAISTTHAPPKQSKRPSCGLCAKLRRRRWKQIGSDDDADPEYVRRPTATTTWHPVSKPVSSTLSDSSSLDRSDPLHDPFNIGKDDQDTISDRTDDDAHINQKSSPKPRSRMTLRRIISPKGAKAKASPHAITTPRASPANKLCKSVSFASYSVEYDHPNEDGSSDKPPSVTLSDEPPETTPRADSPPSQPPTVIESVPRRLVDAFMFDLKRPKKAHKKIKDNET